MDSECNGLMLKNRALLKDLDDSFSDEVGNANGSRTAFEVRGTARCLVLDSKGKQCELELKKALIVPNYARNHISGEKLAQQGEELTFGKK